MPADPQPLAIQSATNSYAWDAFVVRARLSIAHLWRRDDALDVHHVRAVGFLCHDGEDRLDAIAPKQIGVLVAVALGEHRADVSHGPLPKTPSLGPT